MGMTIDEAIKQLETYTIPCGKYKVAYDLAIETMRKYQMIQDVVADFNNQYNHRTPLDLMCEVKEVVEDADSNQYTR